MTDYTVTVTGATGKTGRYATQEAARRGWRVRAAARRAPAAGGWIRFDWDDEGTWRPAFAGSEAAYVVIPTDHPGAPERAPDLLATVAGAGVRRIVLLSAFGVEYAPEDSPLRAAELALGRLPGIESAIVRPTWFLDNFTDGVFGAMAAAGELRIPAGDGRLPFVDARDIAAVAVAALADGGPTGPLPVTGPQPLDHHEVAEALTAAWGRPVRYLPVTAEEFVETIGAQGFPRPYAAFLAELLGNVAAGRVTVPVVDTVERVVGRAPYSIADFAAHRTPVPAPAASG
jgi:uncharacterized protein YbjT (DUF2867 family)